MSASRRAHAPAEPAASAFRCAPHSCQNARSEGQSPIHHKDNQRCAHRRCAAACLPLAGCFTHELYEDKSEYYPEQVSGFMITQDGKQLVVLGKRYHYIFALPEALRAVLVSRYRRLLKSSFSSFAADGSAVTGDYRTLLPKDAPEDARHAALADGFTQRADGLVLGGHLEGKCYSTEGFEARNHVTSQAFNKPYTVTIKEAPSAFGKGLRLLATPVTVAADGVLMLGGLLLLPVILIDLHNHPLQLF